MMLTVPCGRCGACLHNRRIDWSFRLNQELKIHLCAKFITLTYNDENVPKTDSGLHSLRKTDYQKWFKKIRKKQSKYTSTRIRYYGVGEYGTNTNRPHYHVILFSPCAKLLNVLDQTWTHGHIDIGDVNEKSIHYITKYHVNHRHFDDQRENEFTTMSRNPGIGYNYITNNLKWHTQNDFLHVMNNGFKQRLPRYYKKKLFTDFKIKVLSVGQQDEEEKRFWKEFEYLLSMGIEDPITEIERRHIGLAEKVKHKANLKIQKL